MRQLLQDLKTGATIVRDVPVARPQPGTVLIQTRATLISPGTERMLVEFGKASLIGKARAQPDKVKQVVDKVRADGLLPTLDTVFKRLDEPLPLGYCNAGVVVEVGADVVGFRPGDRVVSNGPHAEMVSVPKNLCARIPAGVSDEQAAFTPLASIALQGIRLAAPALGERHVVYGLGLIGLVTVQLLQAHGCQVLGIDLDARRLRLAEAMGARVVDGAASDVAAAVEAWTEGHGADGVLVTASAKSDEIMQHAARMCRRRGRIILVGVVGLNLRRSDFYDKEITFQVSCSYGPGRYDERYEQGGQDYPFGFVRWTEQRNFEAILVALNRRQLLVDDLITHRFSLDDAAQAYDKITTSPDSLGVILDFPEQVDRSSETRLPPLREGHRSASSDAVVGVIGAGNFSKMTLMPALAKTGARIRYLCDLNGTAAVHLARKFGAESAVTDIDRVLSDPDVNTVIIAVGHDLHARFVCQGLEAGKHVFVEKPLATTEEDLLSVVMAARRHGDRHLMVGFNRRFSPFVRRMAQLLEGRAEPLAMSMTVNAGAIPAGHWVHDPVRGGGRIIGEACHFIDLMAHLAGSRVRAVGAVKMGRGPVVREDKASILLSFEDGSVGTVNYFANGAKTYPKEVLEVFSEGRVLRLDNFRRLEGHGFRGFRSDRSLVLDKGHAGEMAAWVSSVRRGGRSPIGLEALVNTTLASFAAVRAAEEERTVEIASELGEVLAVLRS